MIFFRKLCDKVQGKACLSISQILSKGIFSKSLNLNSVYTSLFPHSILKLHIFFHDLFFCRDFNLILQPRLWNTIPMCRVSRQIIDHFLSLFMVHHDLMQDLCQFSIRSRHQNRCQCRVKIIPCVPGGSDHILSVRPKLEFTAVFIFLIHPAKIYRILIHRVHSVRRLLPIFYL